MEKGACVNIIILIWTILACLVVKSSAGRGAQWDRNVEVEKKKSIICYQCNSEFDPNCGDPFNNFTLGTVDCSLKVRPEHLDQNITATICRKTVQKVYGKVRVIRSCGYITDKKHDDIDCLKRTGTHDVHVLYCSCTKDKCNSGNAISVSLPMTVLAIITVLFTTRKCIA